MAGSAKEGLALLGANAGVTVEIRLDKVVARVFEEQTKRYTVYLEGGHSLYVTEGMYDIVGNYLHSLFPGESEGEVVIRD